MPPCLDLERVVHMRPIVRALEHAQLLLEQRLATAASKHISLGWFDLVIFKVTKTDVFVAVARPCGFTLATRLAPEGWTLAARGKAPPILLHLIIWRGCFQRFT